MDEDQSCFAHVIFWRPLLDIQVIWGLWEKGDPSADRLQGKQHPQGRTRLQLEKEKEGNIQRQLADIGVLQRLDFELQRIVWGGFQELGGAADGVE